MSRIHSRPYRGPADLELLLDFVGRAVAARWPRRSHLHLGDVVWRLCPNPDVAAERSIRLWLQGEELVGYVWFASAENAEIDALPHLASDPKLAGEMLAWAKSRRLEIGAAEGWWDPEIAAQPATRLILDALDRDRERIALLEHDGFHKLERHGILLRRDTKAPILDAPLPPGAAVRHARGDEYEALAEAHTDAWGHLDHIGIRNARSGLTPDWYRRLSASPVYDPELNLAVDTGAGDFACCCLCWMDSANGIGFFEPVGTRLAFRRRGFARAMIAEGLRRLRARGAHTVLMGTASINAPAANLYQSCGFHLDDRCHWYAKRLD